MTDPLDNDTSSIASMMEEDQHFLAVLNAAPNSDDPFPWDQLLTQSEFWMDKHRTLHRITEMETRYLLNVLPFIRRAAGFLYTNLIAFSMMLRGEMALEYAEREADRFEDWRTLPLTTAIIEELKTRDDFIQDAEVVP